MKKSILAIMILLLNQCSCMDSSLNNQQNIVDKISSETNYQVFNDSIVYTVDYRGSSVDWVRIITTLNEKDTSVLLNCIEDSLNCVYATQKILFYHGDTMTRELTINNKGFAHLRNGQEVQVGFIRIVSAIPGRKSVIYKFTGHQLDANGTTEFRAFYSVKGDVLYEKYGSEEVFPGDFDKLISACGISDSESVSPLINGIWIYPFRYAGEEVRTRLR